MEIDPKPPDPPDISHTTVAGSKRHLNSEEQPSNPKKTIVDSEMASASIQNVYTHPSLVLGIKSYTILDKGPFVVHISRSEPHPAAGTTIKPIKFGQFLYQNKIPNICVDGVKRVGRNKVSVEFKTGVDANNFLDNPLLESHKYEATIPTYNITKMGIARHVPLDLSMDELVNSLKLPARCGCVLKARRLNRKTMVEGSPVWTPIQTVVITFQGQILPEKIFLFHTSLPIEPYQFPTILCMNCCRFGHVKVTCRSSPRCFRCAQSHSGESCQVIESEASCIHCSGRHFATNKSCPEQGRQKAIKSLMSQENMSYQEASKRYPNVTRPYSEAAQVSSRPFNQFYPPSQVRPTESIPFGNSYRKSIFSTPRARAPLGKSYDRATHRAIIAEVPSSLPNGHALSQSPSLIESQDNLLEILLTTIVGLISKNNINPPSHVAEKLAQIISLLNQNESPDHSTVES